MSKLFLFEYIAKPPISKEGIIYALQRQLAIDAKSKNVHFANISTEYAPMASVTMARNVVSQYLHGKTTLETLVMPCYIHGQTTIFDIKQAAVAELKAQPYSVLNEQVFYSLTNGYLEASAPDEFWYIAGQAEIQDY